MRELIFVAVMALLSLLVVAKGDKQIVHMLEGKLFRQGRAVAAAGSVYARHKGYLPVILFMLGFVGIALSVIALVYDSPLFLISAFFSIAALGLGVWSRINSFKAADKELGDQARS